ncbi:MAG TPA: HDOD domain-containing protein [Terriglobales bacterium]|jgi:HD-like signal output (HDOD) protein|nr:HDOD domain-containing protein [Terriglobales bacterium]
MSEQAKQVLLRKLEELEQMPSLPVVLGPLLRYFEQPLERLDVQAVVDLISQDKSLAAQCLHMANSPLFGRWQRVDSVRNAVVALGMQRMRDIALSCSMLKLVPDDQKGIDPTVFWEHSLGCALVSRRFARRIEFADHSKAYLAGLLHDLGIIVNLWILPQEFGQAMELARSRQIPLHEAELETMGLTHCESGRRLAEKWGFPPELVEVVDGHHRVESATNHRALLALVSLSDLLCRMNGLGHGFVEERQVDFLEQPGFALLLAECPTLETFDWARFTFELEGYMDEVHRLVSVLYRPK